MAGMTTETGRRGARRAMAPTVAGLALAVGGLASCSSEQARTCTEQSGATFCVERKGSGVEPTAEGLQPGSTLSFSVSGAPGAPFSSEVGPSGGPDSAGVIGSLGPAGARDMAGEQVVFTGTAADGSPVSVTLEVPG